MGCAGRGIHLGSGDDRHRASHTQPDEYFLLGDNRPASLDSRSFGPVKSEYPVGRVWLRGLPVDRFWVFEPPIYEEFSS